MGLKEIVRSWWARKKKEYVLRIEDRKRGGKVRRDEKRKERREETQSAKWAMYSDLQSGWMIGDFRISAEDAKKLTNWNRMTLSEMESIYLNYRAWHNHEMKNPY